ncbi:hypothetical protein [Spirosoma validum]|uniref:Uncharacterized protein n=1 Tax=Spirosoma validum TaxID=2771355 RepID=A0A927GC96_9BACT|nr:hypothetical protein [Spirosoma validum]MBD2752231.1 hypothetical protein [Spirosoma validum]
MTSNKQDRVEETAQKGEATVADALAKADRLMAKTATLRHQVRQLKDALAEEIAIKEQKKHTSL